MIKVNLLPQKRAKRGRRDPAASGTDAATRHLLIGIGSLVAAGALVFLLVDMPLRGTRADLKQKNQQLTAAITEKQNQLVGYDVLQQQEQETVKKIQAIDRLVASKIVPANVLHELGYILSSRGPTMTERRRRLTKNDPSKQYQEDWDPNQVSVTAFTDNAGKFTLEGAARSRDDITQLSKRLDASVYFTNIEIASGEPVTDRDTGLSYYKFTITGKVAY
jgi:Tfp pilus assembly protein PilN